MAYSLLGSVSAGSTGANSVTTGSADTTGANLLVLCLASYDGVARPAITDSKGNTWTAIADYAKNNGSPRSTIFYCYGGTVGSGHTFTASGTSSTASIAVLYFSGAVASPKDKHNGTITNSAGTIATGSVTPTNNNQLLVAMLGRNLGIGTGVTINGGFTITNQIATVGSNHFGIGAAYLIQTTATAANPTWTDGASDIDMTAAIATFFSAGADTTPPTITAKAIPASGARADLTFSESVTGLAAADYKVLADGVPVGIASVSGSGTAWFLNFGSRWIKTGQTVTLQYTGTATIDGASNALATFSASSVTNNSTVTAKQIKYVGREFGLFLHFNTNTFLDNDIADGSQSANIFAPSSPISDCVDNWIAAAQLAGMKYLVLTTKHHAGFALWPSASNSYNITASSWYAGAGSPDVIQIFVTKCRAAGMGVVFYYSPWDKHWETANPGFNSASYTAFTVAQLTELLTNYGPIDGFWLDGWGWVAGGVSLTTIDYATIRALFTSLQPNCMMNINTHEHNLTHSDLDMYEEPYEGVLPSANLLIAEQCTTIRLDSKWFYHSAADTLMTAANVIAMRSQVNSRRGTYLLNVPPDTTGKIPVASMLRLADIGKNTLQPTLNATSSGSGSGVSRSRTV